jgi:hypothetical protein
VQTWLQNLPFKINLYRYAKDYTDKARALVIALSESLEFEASNPSDAVGLYKLNAVDS